MRFFRKCIVCCLASLASWGLAAEITEDIAHRVDGFEIPIMVVAPERGEGPFPVVYHVHGGGWNGGTETSVPGASVPSGFRLLTDELGIIHVGLAYRCKIQGSFADAMNDLRASVKWFEERAREFGGDLSRVGFSGGSAGTTLSSLMAQEVSNTKTYVGFYGVYDLLDNEDSLFPDEEARAAFGLSRESDKRAASAFHNLRQNPAAALLFHGGKDILTHPTQSLKFAKRLNESGGDAESIIYPEVNHGFFGERYPVAFEQSLMRVADLYVDQLGIDEGVLPHLRKTIRDRVQKYLPVETLEAEALLGKWVGKHESFEFVDATNGTWIGRRKQTSAFEYRLEEGAVIIEGDSIRAKLYMQKDEKALYQITEGDVRRNGQRFHFSKEK